MGSHRIEAALRRNRPPIIGRIESDRYLLDVRTLQPGDEIHIQEAFRAFLAGISMESMDPNLDVEITPV
jgi:L-seryl-tRNA(Ser) seleniumtransferase